LLGESETKRAHIGTILVVILLSLSLITSSHPQKALASSLTTSNGSQSGLTTRTGSANSTDTTAASPSQNATAADLSEPAITVPQDKVVEASSAEGVPVTYVIRVQDNVDGNATLEEDGISVTQDNVRGNITISCNKASGSTFLIGNTEVECGAADAAGNEGNASFTVTVNTAAPPLPTTAVNATAVNSTQVVEAVIVSGLPVVFIAIVFAIIVIPLGLDIWLAYHRKPTRSSTDKENGRVVGMPGLYRSLMTFGIIVLVGTVIFYLLALITLNINNPTSPVLLTLVDVLRSLGTILGTALATIIAFYFGMRGAESATEKAAAALKPAGEKVPPKVLNTDPDDRAREVPVNSVIKAAFSEPMSSPTINANTFTVRKEGVPTPIAGTISLSPDGKTAIFDPEPDLDPATKYTAEINEGAKDLAGNPLVATHQWSFSTAPAPGPSDSGEKEKRGEGLAGKEETPATTTAVTRSEDQDEDEDEYEYEK
jgi:hypothetical protein